MMVRVNMEKWMLSQMALSDISSDRATWKRLILVASGTSLMRELLEGNEE